MSKEVTLKMVRDHSGSQNTLLKMKKSDQQENQVFISRQQRFPRLKSTKNQQPGPGAYIDPLARSRQIQNLQNRPNKSFSNHLDSFVSRQHQWIFGSNRLNFSTNGSGLGPGAYEIVSRSPQKSTQGWSKSDRFNGNQWNQNSSETAIGPGSYNLSHSIFARQNRNRNQMGIFKSKSPKTFLQKIQKDIQKSLDIKGSSNGFQPFNTKQTIQEDSHLIKSQQKETKKKKQDPSFLSSSKRYELINPENGIAGPGSYELDVIVKSRTKKVKSISTSLHQHSKKSYIKQKKIEKQPGPFSYNIDKYNLEKQMKKKISSLKGNMSLEQRFKSDPKTKSITLPGPGHYNRQRYMFIDEKDYQHKPLVNHYQKVQIPFLSSASRVKQQIKPSPFGFYNLNVFDMSEKIKRKRNHLQKLRAMDISVPGFQSSERRTAFNLGKLMKQQFQKLKGSANKAQKDQSPYKD